MTGSPAPKSGPIIGAEADVTILEVGAWPVTASAGAGAIAAIREGRAALLAADRNSTCHVLRWRGEGTGPETVVVKVPRRGPQRTNDDMTYAGEAAILARLPGAGIANASRLVARVAAAGEHYLIVSHLDGEHPDPVTRPLTQQHLAAMIDSLARMDDLGLMHYDLKPANVLVDGDDVAFLDFEFARFEPYLDACAASGQDFAEDFNVAGNPHFPSRTNVANFEFRTLYRYCNVLSAAQPAGAAATFFRRWLACRAHWHARRAMRFDQLGATSADRIGAAGALTPAEARCRLAAAADYERLTAELLARPAGPVAALEWALVAFRHHVFEQRVAEARALRCAIDARLECWCAVADSQTRPYVEAAARTVRRIARSRAPGTRRPSIDFAESAGRAASPGRSLRAAGVGGLGALFEFAEIV
jgi:predicted Ser/Thr protein kinase